MVREDDQSKDRCSNLNLTICSFSVSYDENALGTDRSLTINIEITNLPSDDTNFIFLDLQSNLDSTNMYRDLIIRLPRLHLSTFFKCILLLLIIYILNLLTGVQYYIWSEKSFENEYSLQMTRIDLNILDELQPEKSLGIPKYELHRRFLISNQYFCSNDEQIIILVKSAIENFQARQAIRMTWANKDLLNKHSIKVLFVLGRSELDLSIEKQYNDLIQIDQIDNYYHNSCKRLVTLELF